MPAIVHKQVQKQVQKQIQTQVQKPIQKLIQIQIQIHKQIQIQILIQKQIQKYKYLLCHWLKDAGYCPILVQRHPALPLSHPLSEKLLEGFAKISK